MKLFLSVSFLSLYEGKMLERSGTSVVSWYTYCPVGTQGRNIIDSMLIQRHDVESTLIKCCFNLMIIQHLLN